MKKSFILILLIIIAGIVITACERDSVTYCPYCSYAVVSEVEPGIYKCGRESCSKKFGAKVVVVE